MTATTGPIGETLAGRAAIVTGGARGLGQVMADAMLAAGASVLVADIDPAPPSEISAHHERLRVVRADVTVRDDVERAVKSCVDAFGGVDVVVNNAGILMREARKRVGHEGTVRFWEVDEDTVRRFLDVHAVGSFLVATSALPHMTRKGSGRIIAITTSFSTMLDGGRTPYGPAKAAMEAFAAIMAKDLTGTGVTVNVLIPGHPRAAGRRGSRESARLPDGRRAEPRVPPEVMGPPVVWLASPASADMTGMRFIATRWDPTIEPRAAAREAGAEIAWSSLDLS